MKKRKKDSLQNATKGVYRVVVLHSYGLVEMGSGEVICRSFDRGELEDIAREMSAGRHFRIGSPKSTVH